MWSPQRAIPSDQVVIRCPQAGIPESNTSTTGSRIVIRSFQVTIRSRRIVIRDDPIDRRGPLWSLSDSDEDRAEPDQHGTHPQASIASPRIRLRPSLTHVLCSHTNLRIRPPNPPPPRI